MLILMNCWWRSSCAVVPSSSGASESVQLRLLSPPITTLSSCSLPRIRSRTRAQSASLQPSGSVCKHRRFALQKRSYYKANQPERNNRLLVVRLILTLVRFASLSVRTDLLGPLVAILLVEKTQRTWLDIKLTSKWFGLLRTFIALKSSGDELGRAKKIINHIQEPGTYMGHHQFEGPPTI